LFSRRSLFSTIIHKFAQTFLPISIDVETGKVYLPPQIEPEAQDFTVQFRVRDFLNVVAIPNGTGKFVDFQRQRGCRKSFTAIVAPD
jgi:hypothetical protein